MSTYFDMISSMTQGNGSGVVPAGSGDTERQAGYHRQDLRGTLLREALAILEEDGLGGLTIRRLSARCGVSHAAPYRHFSSKDEIVAILMQEGHRLLESEQEKALASLGEPGTVPDETGASLTVPSEATPRERARARLDALCRAYLSFATAHPTHLRLMFSRESIQAVVRCRSPLPVDPQDGDLGSFGPLLRTVRECIERGAMATERPAEVVAMSLWSHIHGLALLADAGLPEEMARHWGLVPEDLLEGMLADMVEKALAPGAPTTDLGS